MYPYSSTVWTASATNTLKHCDSTTGCTLLFLFILSIILMIIVSVTSTEKRSFSVRTVCDTNVKCTPQITTMSD